MLSIIWFAMIILSVVCSIITGRMESITAAVTDGTDKAIQLIISMAGVMSLWSGIMKIAEKSGVTEGISKLLSPLLKRLMPEYEPESPAMQAVSANITANILGLGNAATPLGIKAMKEMQRTNNLIDTPNRSMIMFVVMNTASIQLIPATIAALRKAVGSAEPYSILPYIWLTSFGALIIGIIAVQIFGAVRGAKNG